jgi:two-component system LytT family response regulator
MRAFLIDDEYYALQRLKMKLEEIGGIDVVGMVMQSSEALEKIAALKPDVVFLDIEMPNITGLELFSSIIEVVGHMDIIFVTAYEQYAVKAFDLDALDYVIKPVEEERLKKAIERLATRSSAMKSPKRNHLTFRCFGKLSVMADGKEANTGLRKKSEELLAYLLYHKGEFVTKEKIMEDLWGDLDREKSANNLYVSYYNLKKHDFSGYSLPLESVRGKMRICLDGISLDTIKFEKLVHACAKVDDSTIETALEALELQCGMLLEENYYRWTNLEQVRLDILYMELLEKTIAYYESYGNRKRVEYLRTKLNYI